MASDEAQPLLHGRRLGRQAA